MPSCTSRIFRTSSYDRTFGLRTPQPGGYQNELGSLWAWFVDCAHRRWLCWNETVRDARLVWFWTARTCGLLSLVVLCSHSGLSCKQVREILGLSNSCIVTLSTDLELSVVFNFHCQTKAIRPLTFKPLFCFTRWNLFTLTFAIPPVISNEFSIFQITFQIAKSPPERAQRTQTRSNNKLFTIPRPQMLSFTAAKSQAFCRQQVPNGYLWSWLPRSSKRWYGDKIPGVAKIARKAAAMVDFPAHLSRSRDLVLIGGAS